MIKKSVSAFLSLLFMINLSFAQKHKRDVIYLKNGSVINGQIISSLPSGQVKIKTKDNSLWVFESSQIDSISKSGRASNQIRNGYFNLTEAGILAGNTNNKYGSPFSLMNISGWQFKSGFSIGAGAGVEFFSETYLPVVADFRYYLKRHGVNPFFGLQGGYSFALDTPDKQYVYQNYILWPEPSSGNTLDIKARGGFLFNPSLGFCTSLNENMAFTFSVGYRIMRHRYNREDNYKIDIDYNRLSIKVGLIFQ
ncbi:MAG: hypothetical protein NTY07_08965 [Bacteroidia bacterium]|nr:hypothetical protein [Bacteroidia bacterium]